MNMLGLAKRTKARILQCSTSEVYGDPDISPQPEEYWGNVNCNGVRSCYDEGKRVAETLFFDYHRQNAVDIRVARIFNTCVRRPQHTSVVVAPPPALVARVARFVVARSSTPQTLHRSSRHANDHRG